MTMTKRSEPLPRPAAELERLAEYYDTHDTSTEMEPGRWVEPQPMATTSLRLPVDVIEQLKQQARARHLRYTSYVRSILERAARGGTPPEIADITERLERIERAVTERQDPGGQKTALCSRRLPSRAIAGQLDKHHCSFGMKDPSLGRRTGVHRASFAAPSGGGAGPEGSLVRVRGHVADPGEVRAHLVCGSALGPGW